MNLENSFSDRPFYVAVEPKKDLNAQSKNAPYTLLTEELFLTLQEGERVLHTFVCSPCQLPEMCLGWLLSEGYICSLEDVESLRISENGVCARVKFCGNSPCQRAIAPVETGPEATQEWLRQAVELLVSEERVYSKTHGTHGCVLSEQAGAVVVCEDIGRYNAMDKAIGTALLQGIDLRKSLLFSSGRIPVGLVKKTVRCGIPILASKATATRQAVEAAEAYRLQIYYCYQ